MTLPLLVPGLAGSFLLLFVESLADLGNPLLLGGNASVLSTEIFLAINGQYDQQKAAALSLVLLIPTLTIFVLQRYYVSRRSYVAVTGKPTTGRIMVKEPLIRWTFIVMTFLVLVLIMVLYLSILLGSFAAHERRQQTVFGRRMPCSIVHERLIRPHRSPKVNLVYHENVIDLNTFVGSDEKAGN